MFSLMEHFPLISVFQSFTRTELGKLYSEKRPPHPNKGYKKSILCAFLILSWQVSKERGEQLAIEYGIKFMETSAKASINVEDAFFTLARDIKVCQD